MNLFFLKSLALLVGCGSNDLTMRVSASVEIEAAEDRSCGVGDWWDITGDGLCTVEDNAGIVVQFPDGSTVFSSGDSYFSGSTAKSKGTVELGGFYMGSGELEFTIPESFFEAYPYEQEGVTLPGVTWVEVELRDPTLTHNVGEYADVSWLGSIHDAPNKHADALLYNIAKDRLRVIASLDPLSEDDGEDDGPCDDASVEPAEVDLGYVVAGTSAREAIWVENTCETDDAVEFAVEIEGDTADLEVDNHLPRWLDPGAMSVINVNLEPPEEMEGPAVETYHIKIHITHGEQVTTATATGSAVQCDVTDGENTDCYASVTIDPAGGTCQADDGTQVTEPGYYGTELDCSETIAIACNNADAIVEPVCGWFSEADCSEEPWEWDSADEGVCGTLKPW
ncbi:hypothetical protein ACFL2M_00820 [Patescibacteria group bacterium]